MKRILKPAILPPFVLTAGSIGLLLRTWLLVDGLDKKGLLSVRHPANFLLIGLSVAVLAVLVLLTGSLKKAPKCSFNYPPSVVGGIGAGIAALGILLTSIRELSAGGDRLVTICALMGLVSTTLLAIIGLSRWKGYRFNVLLHGFICLYMMLHLIGSYRQFSSEPQLMVYLFRLLSMASLVLAVFFRTGFDMDLGNRRMLVITHLAAVFFSLLAIPGSEDWLYFFTVSIWMLTDLCSLSSASAGQEE